MATIASAINLTKKDTGLVLIKLSTLQGPILYCEKLMAYLLPLAWFVCSFIEELSCCLFDVFVVFCLVGFFIFKVVKLLDICVTGQN